MEATPSSSWGPRWVARRELVFPFPPSFHSSSDPPSLALCRSISLIRVLNTWISAGETRRRYVIRIAFSRRACPSNDRTCLTFPLSRRVPSQQATLRARVTAGGHFLYGNTHTRCARRPNHPSVHPSSDPSRVMRATFMRYRCAAEDARSLAELKSLDWMST